MRNDIHTDVVIAGSGVAGLFCALNLSDKLKVLVLSKDTLENSDSFLAQGGMCVLKEEADYESYFEDTMRAGHYENTKESVEIMLRDSKDVAAQLVEYDVQFTTLDGGKPRKGKDLDMTQFRYTKEGAHSSPRILFHKDITGKEITSKLLIQAKNRPNITLSTQQTVTDLLVEEGSCKGFVVKDNETDATYHIYAERCVFATGGIGGLYKHSTNFAHLTGDALEICKKHGIALKNLDYVQIHPTTFYSTKPGRRFLISESVRGEGALLYDHKMQRFVDELLPRDVVTKAIHEKMEEEGSAHVWLDMRPLGEELIKEHFPNIYEYCLENGYDATKECIPVVPAQHYFMGGIHVDANGNTTMDGLYAVGETACNGVHGANRLASNSLLESMVWAKRAALEMNRELIEQMEDRQ